MPGNSISNLKLGHGSPRARVHSGSVDYNSCPDGDGDPNKHTGTSIDIVHRARILQTATSTPFTLEEVYGIRIPLPRKLPRVLRYTSAPPLSLCLHQLSGHRIPRFRSRVPSLLPTLKGRVQPEQRSCPCSTSCSCQPAHLGHSSRSPPPPTVVHTHSPPPSLRVLPSSP